MVTQFEHDRYRFSVDAYHKMGEAGIFDEDDRVELIDGEIIEMSPVNWPHIIGVDMLNMLLAPALVGRAVVRVQSPVYLDESTEPLPDLTVLKYKDYLSLGKHE